MTSDVIELEELHKAYGDVTVLRGLNLRVHQGEVYGLLGPNGAGKSTLIHLMLGFLRPSSGRLRILGDTDLERVRGRVGYIPERQRYHARYNAREYLRFLGRFSGLPAGELNERVEREIETVGLLDAADRPLGTYSKGMLQRLGVAQALLADPDLLLIDEPTSGLDPAGQREVLDLLGAVRARGHTVFLCTHYLQEVDRLCDRVGVLTEGRIIAEAHVRDLRTPGSSVLIQVSALDLETRRALEGLAAGVRTDQYSVRLHQNTPQLQAQVLRVLLDAGVAVIALDPIESPLERLYLRAVRGELPSTAPPALPPWATAMPGPPLALSLPPPTADPGPGQPRRQGEGDTLLNELLKRNNDDEPGARDQNPE